MLTTWPRGRASCLSPQTPGEFLPRRVFFLTPQRFLLSPEGRPPCGQRAEGFASDRAAAGQGPIRAHRLREEQGDCARGGSPLDHDRLPLCPPTPIPRWERTRTAPWMPDCAGPGPEDEVQERVDAPKPAGRRASPDGGPRAARGPEPGPGPALALSAEPRLPASPPPGLTSEKQRELPSREASVSVCPPPSGEPRRNQPQGRRGNRTRRVSPTTTRAELSASRSRSAGVCFREGGLAPGLGCAALFSSTAGTSSFPTTGLEIGAAKGRELEAAPLAGRENCEPPYTHPLPRPLRSPAAPGSERLPPGPQRSPSGLPLAPDPATRQTSTGVFGEPPARLGPNPHSPELGA
ncbi:basic salivary proline-rich protein 3-like [Diceros bicornis minor]|uniref:basic salivary proline-rich protein 3-like n=1 Tax=Diceros bicornis minor TaxID=77932 RepID=UPI0026F26483|nr:basic salivary proline-rich protein 3-like [Diceros bicornis minor]